MNTQTVLIGIAVLISIYIVLWCFIRPVKFLVKIAVKSLIGYFALFLCNHFLAGVGFSVGLNLVTALVCGILGANGFLLLTGLNFLLP